MDLHDIVSLFDRGNTTPSWHAANKHLFPSEPSCRWFMRRHRDTLVANGAIVKVRGIWYVNAPVMDRLLPELLKADSIAA